MRHGSDRLPGPEVIQTAHRAVDLAAAANDTSALARATLAVHDAMWTPGTAAARLPVIAGPERAETLRSERDALIREIAAAAGLGGRDRKLGDETERARKTVGARVRDAQSKIERVHPELAAHLRSALQMGTVCSYTPSASTTWKVS